MEASRVTYQLLRRLDEPTRFQVLKDAVAGSESVSTIVREVALLEPEGEVYQSSTQDDVYLSGQHLQELKKSALKKIREAAQRGILINTPELARIMYRWSEWAGEYEPTEWSQEVCNDDKSLALFLETFLLTTRSLGGSDLVARITYRLDPQSLEPFLEPSEIIDRVKHLVEADWLTERQGLAMTRFIEGYEMRERGEDPNLPHS